MEIYFEFRDIFKILNTVRVRYLVVGAHAVGYFTEPRYTKDLDIWTAPTPDNANRVWKALARFGAPLQGVTEQDFTNPKIIYQIGIDPHRIDILTTVGGLDFAAAWNNRIRSKYEGIKINVLSLNDLIVTKRAAGRPQDLIDLKHLLRKKNQ